MKVLTHRNTLRYAGKEFAEGRLFRAQTRAIRERVAANSNDGSRFHNGRYGGIIEFASYLEIKTGRIFQTGRNSPYYNYIDMWDVTDYVNYRGMSGGDKISIKRDDFHKRFVRRHVRPKWSI